MKFLMMVYCLIKKKIEAVKKWPKPENVQQVRQFLGLSQHYRRFVRNFSTIAAPLTKLTQGTGPKKRAINWTPECQASFDNIKQLLISAPVLQAPDMKLPFRIETDSSNFGVGAVLLQPNRSNPSLWHPIAYESKKLSEEEMGFPCQERELISIVHALRTWRCYVDGCSAGYEVYSDHNPLVYFRKQTKPTPRLVRWISELEMYSPIIKYKPGPQNNAADALSRAPVLLSNSPDNQVKSLEPEYLYAIWSELSEEEKSNWPLIFLDYQTEAIQDPKLKVLLEKEFGNFVVKDGNVYKKIKYRNKDKEDVEKEVKFIPFSERADLVSKYHEGYGHAGVKNMNNMFCVRYWWPKMRQDIETWVKRCPSCQVCAKQQKASQDVMHPLDVPHAFERWHIDFIGELPTTINGNRWLITAVDYTTNWPIARAMPKASKEAVAQFIYEEIVLKFGCPNEIITDRGANFTSGLVEEYLKRIGTNHKLTSAFHPRTNAKVERYNGIIKQMLRKYVKGDSHRWDEFVDAAVWASRVRVHSTTGFSPFYLVYGRDPKIPGDALQPYICPSTVEEDEKTVATRAVSEMDRIVEHRSLAESRLKEMGAKDKERWDATIKPRDYAVGDLVLLKHEGNFGLEPSFKGPFIIKEAYEDYGTYSLETLEGEELKSRVHKDRLKRAHGDKPQDAWYEPTASRRNVKAVTSTRSGRGGGTCFVPSTRSVQAAPSITPGNLSVKESIETDLEKEDIISEDTSMHGSSSTTPVTANSDDCDGGLIQEVDEEYSSNVEMESESHGDESINVDNDVDDIDESINVDNDTYDVDADDVDVDGVDVGDVDVSDVDVGDAKDVGSDVDIDVDLEKIDEEKEKQEEYQRQALPDKKEEELKSRTLTDNLWKPLDCPAASLSRLAMEAFKTKAEVPKVPIIPPVTGTVPSWPFTFTKKIPGSSTDRPHDESDEELQDLIKEVSFNRKKRMIFKPTIPPRKRGKVDSSL